MTNDEHQGELEDEDVASPGELRRAIETLGVGDTKKLERIARFWWAHYKLQGRSGSPSDLLQAAVERCLEHDRRRWRKKRVGIVKFLDGVIRSIASHEVESAMKEKNRVDLAHALDTVPEATGTASPVPPPPSSNPESRLAAREELGSIEALFEGEPRTLEVLRCKAQGMTEGEIRDALQMDDREFARRKKRILRSFVAYKKGQGEEHGNQ